MSDVLALPSADLAQVWRARLDLGPAGVDEFASLLSADERERAAQYRFELHRQRFTVGRALLRILLGAYLDQPPASITLAYGPHGKPDLAVPPRVPLRFNLSHADNVALFAFSAGRELGVDIESTDRGTDTAALSCRFFPSEQRALAALPNTRRRDAFYACWTRKEAFLKATGSGLSFPLDAFDVTLAPDLPAALLEVRGAHHEAGRWGLHALQVAPGFAAALAVEGREAGIDGRLKRFCASGVELEPVSAQPMG